MNVESKDLQCGDMQKVVRELKKVRKKDSLNYHLDADEHLSKIRLKLDYHDAMLNFLESILKQINNRTYQIKNAIEWQNFQRGF